MKTKPSTLLSPSSRRRFLTTGAAAFAGIQIVPRHVLGAPGEPPPSEKLSLGVIGCGGQGAANIGELEGSLKLVNITALCDVDLKHAGGTFTKYPQARAHRDFRKLIDDSRDLDAILIATPDHLHAPAAIRAMRAGKHVYVEKPMAHTIGETRKLLQVARETGVVTQMGNNGHGGEGLRLTREWIQAGVIGKVREVHSWSDRPGTFWNTQGKAYPTDTPPVPATLDWDLWLGPAQPRPYHPDIAPRKWRGWWDFGCGALGDMAVHNADPAFYAFDLDAPIAVSAEHSPNNNQSFPEWSVVKYEFAAKGDRPAVNLTWHDGGKKPPRPAGLEANRELGDNGIYFVGDQGVILCGGWSGAPRLIPEARMKDFQAPAKTLARSPGHRREWVEACKAKNPKMALAGFDYSAPFTEALLVGLLAIRFGKRVEWDSANLRSPNTPEADRFIHKDYRAGFEA